MAWQSARQERPDEIRIQEVAGGDDGFQNQQWRLQRFSWVVMTLVILAALAGAFGDGWLSGRQAGNAAVSLSFQRIVRAAAMTIVDIGVSTGAAGNGNVQLWMDRGYVDRIEVTEIMPPPRRVSVAADRLVFDFAATPPAAPSAMPLHIRFRIIPHRPGRLDGHIGVGAGPPFAIHQFVLP